MPIVTIQITREGTTGEQKAALIRGATDWLANVLNKPPGLTFVIIQEVELDDWGVGGLPVPEYRRQAGTGRSSEAGHPHAPSSDSEVGRQHTHQA